MLLLLQNVLYCLLYASLIKCAVRNDGRNCLYFYPKEYIEEAQKRGIADKETVMKRSKWFMIPFCIIIFVALILIISVWNHVMDFKTAYLQACLFLVVMNWFDGIVIDRLWVGHSRIWHIDGMEGICSIWLLHGWIYCINGNIGTKDQDKSLYYGRRNHTVSASVVCDTFYRSKRLFDDDAWKGGWH